MKPIRFTLFALLFVLFCLPMNAFSGEWSSMTSGTTKKLLGVWGSSGSDVFAVGFGGTILHYNGNAWSAMISGTTKDLFGVWGSSGSDVFAVGFGSTILHYNGNAWSAMISGTTKDLCGVWGSSGSDVFAVGYSGTILHYNGNAWSAMASGKTEDLHGVWGSSGSDVFAVGDESTILHYNGGAWSAMSFGTYNNFNGVWGSSGSDVYAVGYPGYGGTIYHYDGTTWSLMMEAENTLFLASVWGSSENNVFAVGADCAIAPGFCDDSSQQNTIYHYDGTTWSLMPVGYSVLVFYSVWGSSGSDVFAVGDSGTILHYTEQTLIELASLTASPKANKVVIQWSTASELDNAGFNLYRAESADGPYTKINAALIPAQGSATQSAAYEFVDRDVRLWRTYFYRLEDIDLNGTATMHGAISATLLLINGSKR